MPERLSERLQTLSTGAFPDLIDGWPALDNRKTWMLSGECEELDAVAGSLPASVKSRPRPDLLLLDFNDAVGRVRLGNLGEVVLRSGKFSATEFEDMLSDLSEISGGLPYSAGTDVKLPYSRESSSAPETLFHSFCYLRYALSDRPPRGERLLPAFRLVVDRPHERFERTTRTVDVEKARSIAPGTEPEILAELTRPDTGRVSEQIPTAVRERLKGSYPRRVKERVVDRTLDTPENRFVKTFLRQISALLRHVREVLGPSTEQDSDSFAERIVSECDELENRLSPVVRRPVWRKIGESRRLPTSSTVLTRRRGYRTILRHFAALRAASTVPLDASSMRHMLEVKDIADLYEIWTFFRVVDQLSGRLGEPSEVEPLRVTPTEVKAQKGLTVTWFTPREITATYNRWFSSKKEDGSYSTGLRPDTVVEVTDGKIPSRHVFDAKFRLRNDDSTLSELWSEDSQGESHERNGTYENANLHKMHTYRDALSHVDSAWTLYPGTEFIFYPADLRSPCKDARRLASPLTGVGAVPLTPNSGEASLEKVLKLMVETPSNIS